ncbi:MAG: hypothetical protein AVDCRST_MAG89-2109, partial [uncultured Gemmatimonadetes bacterium]
EQADEDGTDPAGPAPAAPRGRRGPLPGPRNRRGDLLRPLAAVLLPRIPPGQPHLRDGLPGRRVLLPRVHLAELRARQRPRVGPGGVRRASPDGEPGEHLLPVPLLRRRALPRLANLADAVRHPVRAGRPGIVPACAGAGRAALGGVRGGARLPVHRADDVVGAGGARGAHHRGHLCADRLLLRARGRAHGAAGALCGAGRRGGVPAPQLPDPDRVLPAAGHRAVGGVLHVAPGGVPRPSGGRAHPGIRGALHSLRLPLRGGDLPSLPRIRGPVAARRAGARLRVFHQLLHAAGRDRGAGRAGDQRVPGDVHGLESHQAARGIRGRDGSPAGGARLPVRAPQPLLLVLSGPEAVHALNRVRRPHAHLPVVLRAAAGDEEVPRARRVILPRLHGAGGDGGHRAGSAGGADGRAQRRPPPPARRARPRSGAAAGKVDPGRVRGRGGAAGDGRLVAGAERGAGAARLPLRALRGGRGGRALGVARRAAAAHRGHRAPLRPDAAGPGDRRAPVLQDGGVARGDVRVRRRGGLPQGAAGARPHVRAPRSAGGGVPRPDQQLPDALRPGPGGGRARQPAPALEPDSGRGPEHVHRLPQLPGRPGNPARHQHPLDHLRRAAGRSARGAPRLGARLRGHHRPAPRLPRSASRERPRRVRAAADGAARVGPGAGRVRGWQRAAAGGSAGRRGAGGALRAGPRGRAHQRQPRRPAGARGQLLPGLEGGRGRPRRAAAADEPHAARRRRPRRGAPGDVHVRAGEAVYRVVHLPGVHGDPGAVRRVPSVRVPADAQDARGGRGV